MISIPRRKACIALAGLAVSARASAQAFPSRAIELLIPFAPGGAVDVMGRMSGEVLSKELGQPVVVRNVPGAGGNISYSRLAKAPPDGYTLGLVGGGLFINSVLRPGGFDPVKSFRPIGHLGTQPFVMLVNPSRVSARTLGEAFDRVRKEPGKFSFSSGGVGASSHVLMEYLKASLNLKMLHVPYTGQGPAINAVLAGEVDMTLQTLAGAEDLVRTGRLVALGVTGPDRLKLFPEIPTFAEAGVKGIDVVGWSGLVAPGALPEPIASRLINAWGAVMAQPDLQRTLESRCVEVKQMTAQQFGTSMQKDKAFWERAIAVGQVKTE